MSVISEKIRIVVVVNKWWECDPVLSVLTNDYVRPTAFLCKPRLLNHPCYIHHYAKEPRAIFDMDEITAEIWCISDLIAHYPDSSCYQSSSELKMGELPYIFKSSHKSADLVIAVGTAASYPVDDSNACPPITNNGCVVIGAGAFLHNGHPSGQNACSNWEIGPFDEKICSPLDEERFNQIVKLISGLDFVPKLFLSPRYNPAREDELGVISSHNYVALSLVNVTDYSEYEKKDYETLAAYKNLYPDDNCRSLETTHGLIRVAAGDVPFMFVSGIVDRLGHFDEDVSPAPRSQNIVGAYNAGVTVAWLLASIDIAYGSPKKIRNLVF